MWADGRRNWKTEGDEASELVRVTWGRDFEGERRLLALIPSVFSVYRALRTGLTDL